MRGAATALLLALAACGAPPVDDPAALLDAEAERGRALIYAYGCGACHLIPGVPGARGLVGPSLENFAVRALIAGQLSNRPNVLIAWLRDPPALIPGTGMPDQSVSAGEARAIAAYLYRLGEAERSDWPPEAPPDRPWFDAPDEV